MEIEFNVSVPLIGTSASLCGACGALVLVAQESKHEAWHNTVVLQEEPPPIEE